MVETGGTLSVDSLLSILGGGACGVAALSLRLRRPSPLQRQAFWLLLDLAALLLLRGLLWTRPEPWLDRLAWLPAPLLPVFSVRFLENLLRRHAPLGLKILAVLGALAFCLADIAGFRGQSAAVDTAFNGFMALSALWVGVELWRWRGDLSPGEKNLASLIAWSLLLIVPLAATDFMPAGVTGVKAGGLAALLLVWLLVEAGKGLEGLGFQMLALSVASAFGALALVGLEPGAGSWERAASLFLAFMLLVELFRALFERSKLADARELLEWMAASRGDSREALREGLKRLPLLREHRLLDGPDLTDFDPRVLARPFGAERSVRGRHEFEAALAGGTPPGPDASEAWLVLLQSHGMDHAFQLRADPPLYALFCHPRLGTASRPFLALDALRTFLERSEFP